MSFPPRKKSPNVINVEKEMKSNLQKRKEGTRKSWVSYKGKTIPLRFEPRKGVCSHCEKIDEHTHLHHTQYDDNDPLAHIVELCHSCHMKQHRKLRT
jgi:hypothetical protein